MKNVTEKKFNLLGAPFCADEIGFKIGQVSTCKTKATALPYIKIDSIMNRLDQVFTPTGWKLEILTSSTPVIGKAGSPLWGVKARLSIKDDGEWVSKEDIGTPASYENLTSVGDDALRRVSAQWGLGRYLKSFKPQWLSVDNQGAFTEHPYVPSNMIRDESATENKYEQFSTIPAAKPETVKQAVAEAADNETNVIQMPSIDPAQVPEDDQAALGTIFDQVGNCPELKDDAINHIESSDEFSDIGKRFAVEFLKANYS